jgi:hypothetical protein
MPCMFKYQIQYFYWLRLRVHGGCDRSAEDACSSMAPDSTFAFIGDACCPTLDLVFALWIMNCSLRCSKPNKGINTKWFGRLYF